ncbi:MAG: CHAT domain-containing protein [Gammaproteobacteria bacterium]|nr:CHAT domain-containing protein [Gammaproteobacteria bacterium]MDH5799932.1 CHAT domain-containing protein [Gammaproteobacteria bacterium]
MGCNFEGKQFFPKRYIGLVVGFSLLLAQNVFALAENAKPEISSGIADTDNKTRAVELFSLGEFGESIAYWKAALAQDQASGDTEGQVISLYNLSIAQRSVGAVTKAIRSLQEAWRRGVKIHNPELKARIKSSLGSLFLYSGKQEKALELLRQARRDAVAIKDWELESMVLNDLGNLYAARSQYDLALGTFEFAALLGEQNKSPLLTAKANTNITSVLVQQGRAKAASRSAVSVLRGLRSQSVSYESVMILASLAQAVQGVMQLPLKPQDRLDRKQMVHEVVRAINQTTDFLDRLASGRLASRVYGAMAAIYEAAEQWGDAAALNSKAIFEAQKGESTDLLYQWQWQAGRIYNKLGQQDDSIRAYRLAVNALQPIRQELSKRQLGKDSRFSETQGNVYLELTDNLLRKTDNLSNPRQRTQLLLEARNTMELQKEAELQDYFKDSCVVNAKNNIKHIDETLADNTAVLYPILLPDRTELLVSFGSGMERYTVKKTEAEVTEEVRALRVRLESLRTRAYLPHARKLYQWLIQPMEADFQKRGINTLVMVADKSLRTIPMSVLHDGEQFLINKYALATSPGLKLTDPRPLQRDNLQILLSGLSESVQGFPALQYVRGELEEIQDLYVGKLLLNREFVSASVAKALRDTNYSVTHIASHSVFSGDVEQSYILTYDDRITVDQLGQFAALSRSRSKPIELLTLSACQTAAGDDRAALGLAGVAIKSGARSALASLWAINDQASAVLITEFYRQLRDPVVTKAQALQRAQSKLMQNVRYRHPGYWSPFLLIGNWL